MEENINEEILNEENQNEESAFFNYLKKNILSIYMMIVLTAFLIVFIVFGNRALDKLDIILNYSLSDIEKKLDSVNSNLCDVKKSLKR